MLKLTPQITKLEMIAKIYTAEAAARADDGIESNGVWGRGLLDAVCRPVGCADRRDGLTRRLGKAFEYHGRIVGSQFDLAKYQGRLLPVRRFPSGRWFVHLCALRAE
jgi:hypothetical protein